MGMGGEPPGSSGAVELPEPEMSNLKDIAHVGGSGMVVCAWARAWACVCIFRG